MALQDWDKTVSLRKSKQDDFAFMEILYAKGRESELAMTNFSPAEKEAFLSQQFNAQTAHYSSNYCTDDFNIVEINGEPCGRLFVDHWDEEIRIVDIALLPQFQNGGLGSWLLQNVFKRAEEDNKKVSIHVEQNNPARRLYERLGFSYKQQTNDIYLLMEWQHN